MQTVLQRVAVEGEPIQIAGAHQCCNGFSLSRWCHYLSTVQIKPFRPSPSYSASESRYFRFSLKICSRTALVNEEEKGGGANFITPPSPGSTVGGTACKSYRFCAVVICSLSRFNIFFHIIA